MMTVLLSLVVLLLEFPPGVVAENECSRFDIGGPCKFLPDYQPPTVDTPVVDPLASYCEIACSYSLGAFFDGTCQCTPPPCTRSYFEGLVCEGAAATCTDASCAADQQKYELVKTNQNVETCDCTIQETTIPDCDVTGSDLNLCLGLNAYGFLPDGVKCDCLDPPTTKPPPRVCYYTSQRPAQLNTRRRRMYQGDDAPDCEYPGVVGLFDMTANTANCMGLVLTEDTIIIDKTCYDFNFATTFLSLAELPTLTVLASSYSKSDLSSSNPTVVKDSPTLLSNIPGKDNLYTVKLSAPLTFDDKCVAPACVPNNELQTTDIDDTSCRLLGYGDTSDAYPSPQPDRLKEVPVYLDASSITGNTLTVIRPTGVQGLSCLNDFTSPLICSNKVTKEWIVVGFVSASGYPCSAPIGHTIQSLLKESFSNNNPYFNQLQVFKYTNDV